MEGTDMTYGLPYGKIGKKICAPDGFGRGGGFARRYFSGIMSRLPKKNTGSLQI